MDFKIDGKTLCVDLSDIRAEQLLLVVDSVLGACECLEEAGHKVNVKIKTEEDCLIHCTN